MFKFFIKVLFDIKEKNFNEIMTTLILEKDKECLEEIKK